MQGPPRRSSTGPFGHGDARQAGKDAAGHLGTFSDPRLNPRPQSCLICLKRVYMNRVCRQAVRFVGVARPVVTYGDVEPAEGAVAA